MLALLVAVAVSQNPVTLQALVPTSGANVEALLDNNARTGWRPEGDSEGEGVLLRFEADVPLTEVRVVSCNKKPVALTPFINGSDYAHVTVEGDGAPVARWKTAKKVRSIFLRFDASSPDACIAEVSFMSGKDGLVVTAPRRLAATAKASSVLTPADAYHPGYLFDGRLDFGWVEGVKGPGLGESMTLTFEQPVTLTALELWNGYQRSADHFKKNARAKKVTVSLDGAAPIEFAVRDVQGAQTLSLPKPTSVTTITLTIKDAFKGSKYDDLVLSELRVWDERGPRAIATPDLAERAAALKAEAAKTPLGALLDVNLRSVCEVDGYEFEAKYRSNHTFVVYRTADDEDGQLKEILDGTWILKDAKTIELFGRSHRTEESYDPYASPGGKETTGIIGGAVSVTRLKDMKQAEFEAVVKRFDASPVRWSFDCAEARDYDGLQQRDAWVLQGRAVTAILAR